MQVFSALKVLDGCMKERFNAEKTAHKQRIIMHLKV